MNKVIYEALSQNQKRTLKIFMDNDDIDKEIDACRITISQCKDGSLYYQGLNVIKSDFSNAILGRLYRINNSDVENASSISKDFQSNEFISHLYMIKSLRETDVEHKTYVLPVLVYPDSKGLMGTSCDVVIKGGKFVESLDLQSNGIVHLYVLSDYAIIYIKTKFDRMCYLYVKGEMVLRESVDFFLANGLIENEDIGERIGEYTDYIDVTPDQYLEMEDLQKKLVKLFTEESPKRITVPVNKGKRLMTDEEIAQEIDKNK